MPLGRGAPPRQGRAASATVAGRRSVRVGGSTRRGPRRRRTWPGKWPRTRPDGPYRCSDRLPARP
ncbi:hypothetical protein ACFFX0_27870 [Citricoccus parietis]|uniref:Uncharacterized protein n=1 Tax=Citricoccus parietis TaxID=592307 RepID=A0ABV5G773_9MICC